MITVGITCYGEGEWLRECWQSVLDQTVDDWRAVLVMDGGASAETKAVYHELSHSRLQKIELEKNSGPYRARNIAFEHTKTPYHFYLDGDDRLRKDCLERLIACINRDPSIEFMHVGMEEIDPLGKVTGKFRKYSELVSWGYVSPHLYRVDTWRRLGGFCEDAIIGRGAADLDFHLSLLESESCYEQLAEVLYDIRIRDGSVSSSYGMDRARRFEHIVSRHPTFFADISRRRGFLRIGYLSAAAAAAEKGETQLARRYAWSAIRCGGWRHPLAYKLLLLGQR